MNIVKRTWLTGGGGLVACGVIEVLRSSLLGTSGSAVLGVVGDLVFAAAVLLLAVGLSHRASVVARKPVGVVAMSVVALWPLISRMLEPLVMQGLQRATDWNIYGYLALIVPASAALVAAVEIGRAAVLPSPWHWAPLWVLAFQAIVWVVPQLTIVAIGPGEVQLYANLFALLGTASFLAGTIGLGVLVLVLATRPHAGSVEVFRSTPGDSEPLP